MFDDDHIVVVILLVTLVVGLLCAFVFGVYADGISQGRRAQRKEICEQIFVIQEAMPRRNVTPPICRGN